MEKVIKYEVKRTIKSTEIKEDFIAYREEIIVGNREPIINEGITTKQHFTKLSLDDDIYQVEDKFQLYLNDIKEFFRNNLFYNSYEEFKELHIDNPYTYIMENGLDNVDLYFIDYYSHNIYNSNNERLPKAIHFDYIQANLHNQRFDLKKSLEILKERNDIIFTKEEGIIEIPYYNQDEYRTHYIDMIWIPSNDEFEKIKDIKDSYTLYRKITEEIFKLPLNPNQEDEDF